MANEKMIWVAPGDILIPQGWNARSGDLTKETRINPETGEEETWEQFAASVKTNGVKTPLVARSVKGDKIELVAGFRRQLAAVQGQLRQVPVIVREYEGGGARLENLRENTARKNLRPADLAWGLRETIKENPAYGTAGGDTLLANELGLSQPYVGKLNKVMVDIKPAITKQWRESSVAVSVKEMYALCHLARDKQDEEWVKLLKGKQEKGARGPNAWKDTVKKKAEAFGMQLGALKRLGLIEGLDGDFLDVLEAAIKMPAEKAKLSDRRAFAKALEAGFAKGQEEPEGKADDDETEADTGT